MEINNYQDGLGPLHRQLPVVINRKRVEVHDRSNFDSPQGLLESLRNLGLA
jgi:hypothetical protein